MAISGSLIPAIIIGVYRTPEVIKIYLAKVYCNIIYTCRYAKTIKSETGPHMIFKISSVNMCINGSGDLASNMAGLGEESSRLSLYSYFELQKFSRDDALRSEFALPTAGGVEWLVFSYIWSH